jgi:hypothetical protein
MIFVLSLERETPQTAQQTNPENEWNQANHCEPLASLLVTAQPTGNGDMGWPVKMLLNAANTLRPCFLIVEM